MALDFKDWGLTPEQTVASRKAAMENYINVAQPAKKEQDARERGQLVSDTYAQSLAAAKQGNVAKGSGILEKAQQLAAEKIPEQATGQDTLNYGGAKAQEDILNAKQTAAINEYTRNTAEYKDKTARALAAKAFEQGYQSKELAMSNNGYLADRGLTQLKADFEAGRVTEAELQKMKAALELQTNDLRNQLQNDLAALKRQMEIDITKSNYEASKARMLEMLRIQKAAALSAAKQNAFTAILSGAVGIAAGVATANPMIGMAAATATKGALDYGNA